MLVNKLQQLPDEVKEIVFNSKITDINSAISKKFDLSLDQIVFIVDLQIPLFLKEVDVLNLPNKLKEIEDAENLDLRAIALELAIKILWPLQDYLGKVDRLILRLGGKVPRLKHLRKTVLQHELFPENKTGIIKELLKKYEDFKDLRLSSKKIVDRNNKKITPSVDNWIKDYIHFSGASSHNSLERSKYFSKNKNILDLNKDEKTSVIEFILAYDKNSMVDIDNYSSILKISKHIKKKEVEEKEYIKIDDVIERLHQDILSIEKEILPSNYILSEIDNDTSKLGNLLWDSIGMGDTEKVLGCLKVLIEKKGIDRLIEEDNRFKSIFKRFIGIKYGNDVSYKFKYEDKLINRRIFLEMILIDKLKNKKANFLAYYLTNLIKGSGQVVYLDKSDGILKWRELQVISSNLVWVD